METRTRTVYPIFNNNGYKIGEIEEGFFANKKEFFFRPECPCSFNEKELLYIANELKDLNFHKEK